MLIWSTLYLISKRKGESTLRNMLLLFYHFSVSMFRVDEFCDQKYSASCKRSDGTLSIEQRSVMIEHS